MSAKQRPAQMCRQQCTHRCTCAAGRWCFTPDYCCDARRRGTQTAARWTVVTDGRPQHRCAGAHRLTAPGWPGSCVSGGAAVLQEWCPRSSFVQLQPPELVLVDPEHPRSFFMPQTVEVRDVVLKPLHLLSAGQVSVHQANDADRGLRDCPAFGEVLPDPSPCMPQPCDVRGRMRSSRRPAWRCRRRPPRWCGCRTLARGTSAAQQQCQGCDQRAG